MRIDSSIEAFSRTGNTHKQFYKETRGKSKYSCNLQDHGKQSNVIPQNQEFLRKRPNSIGIQTNG